MKLSNTLIFNEKLLSKSKNAFTLAEVLITLSILGVVAALTIPSLVNRQSEMAAIVKMKKAISQFEQVASTYMAENNTTSTRYMVRSTDSITGSCDNLKNYFKVVKELDNSGCSFTTADGVVWKFDFTDDGKAVVYDSETSPHYGVIMYVASEGDDAGKINPSTPPQYIIKEIKSTATPQPTYYYANEMLKINKPNSNSASIYSGTWVAGP